MGLLDLVIQYSPVAVGKEEAKKISSSKSIKFASEIAHKALNLMVLLRPVTMVTSLAKEVATFLASQHVTHFPHSSLPPIQVCACMCERVTECVGGGVHDMTQCRSTERLIQPKEMKCTGHTSPSTTVFCY